LGFHPQPSIAVCAITIWRED